MTYWMRPPLKRPAALLWAALGGVIGVGLAIVSQHFHVLHIVGVIVTIVVIARWVTRRRA
jgi:hypothetical protein